MFSLVLCIALFKDMTAGSLEDEGILYREGAGGADKEVGLVAEIEGMDDTYRYQFVIEPMEITRAEAEDCFAQARSIIEKDFSKLSATLPIKDSYVSDVVEAEWSFSPAEYIRKDGAVEIGKVLREGGLVQVSVLLTCGQYEEIYTFPIYLEESLFSEEEKIKAVLEEEIQELSEQTNLEKVELPRQVQDREITWSERKEYLFLKILLLEIVALGLMFVVQRKKVVQEKEQRRIELELSYADLVNQLAILLRAGLTMRQAWNRIAMQYGEHNAKENDAISEMIQHMNMRLKEGEKERIAYEKFAKEAEVVCYRRLMRMLIGNLEKGSADICNYLEEESRRAYEERIVIAKKKGEEASTKMLFPLMIMMVLVMSIVLIPALVSFTV